MKRIIPVPRGALRIVVVLTLCSSTAFGQELEAFPFSSPVSGTKLSYKNLTTGVSTTRTYLETGDQFKIRYQISSNTIRERYLFCKYCGSTKNEIDISNYQQLFPLEVGKTTEFRRWKKNKPETSWTHSITVQEVRQVKSQLGGAPVDVFVVYEEIINNQKDWKGSMTYWFSPELKSNISIIDNAADNLDQISITQLVKVVKP